MRIFYLILGGLMAVSLVALAGATGDSVVEDSSGGASIGDGATTATGTVLLGTQDIQDGDDWYKRPIATDAAPNPTTLVGQSSIVSAATVAPTNQTGGNIAFQPGTGLRTMTVLNAAGVATVTLQSQTDGVLNTPRSLVIGTICAAGGLTVAQCACLVYDALVATPAVGIATPTRLDGTCSNARLAFAVTPGVASAMTIATTDAAVAAVVSGANGNIVPGGGMQFFPDATWNIGAASSGRPKNIWAENSITAYLMSAYTYTSPTTGSIGWHIVSAANQACDTTCTSGAVFGWDSTTPVNHDDATADTCLCAGAN